MRNNILNSRLTAILLFFIIFAPTPGCIASETDKNQNSAIIAVYPHDKNSQTEGLIYLNGFIYEGTGPCKDGPSSLRRLDLKSGKILQYLSLPSPIFGEGITVFGDKIIQLTYRTKIGYVYGLKKFNLIGKFNYETEGWGLTNDGKHLIMSDGTSTLHFIDPETFKEVKKIQVHDKNGEIRAVNELEYINGFIYANIFLTDNIIKIRSDTGMVMSRFNLNEILGGYFKSSFDEPANGIAYDPVNKHLLVTGKYWPYLFRIKIPK